MEKNTPTIYDIPLTPATITRHIYLTESFETPSEYIQTCQALLELEEYDRAELHINSGGGSVAVSNMVCNAMSKSKARVCTVLESDCHSAASVIFLLGDEFEVTPEASMILHVGFFGAFGEKASDTVKDASFTESVHFDMIRRAYEGFLTPEEIEELLEGKNFRLNSAEIIKRLGELVEYRERKMQEMYEELNPSEEVVATVDEFEDDDRDFVFEYDNTPKVLKRHFKGSADYNASNFDLDDEEDYLEDVEPAFSTTELLVIEGLLKHVETTSTGLTQEEDLLQEKIKELLK